MDLPVEIRRLAAQQRGVVRRAQLLSHGVTADRIRWQLGRSWRLLLPGVLLLSPALPSEEQRHIAALLYAGPGSWLSGESALTWHRMRESRPGARVTVLVPAPRRPRDVGWVSIRRTHLVDERVLQRGPLRFSCRARAVVDAAASLGEDEARELVISSVQERAVRLDDLVHWVEARRPNDRRRLRAALAEAAAGAWSVPEAELAKLVRSSRLLPEAWANPTLHDADGHRLTTPDLWFDDIGMAVMVHSRRFHGAVLSWESTVAADTDLIQCRVVVVGVTPGAIARDPRRTLARIEKAYASARAAGARAPVVATPRVTAGHVAGHLAPTVVLAPPTPI